VQLLSPRRHDDLKEMLDSNKDSLKLEAMKRIVAVSMNNVYFGILLISGSGCTLRVKDSGAESGGARCLHATHSTHQLLFAQFSTF